MAEEKKLLEIENLRKYFPVNGIKGPGVQAVQDVSLYIKKGETLGLVGESGCGKTTLLRQLKTSIAPHGRSSGKIEFKGRSLEEMDDRTSARQIGFVQQDVDAQLVTDKVWHELAFGLESLGYDNGYIRRRVAEMCSFFGLSGIFHRRVAELSGGQKQMVNLASVMALSPEVLILDEPTSQLDPIAANEFIACLVRINRELGTTIIMTEHRLEEVLPVCSRAVVMDEGTVLCQGTVKEVAATLKNEGQRLKEKGINRNGLYLSMPAAVQVYLGLDGSDESPGETGCHSLTISTGNRGMRLRLGMCWWMKGMPGRQMVRKLTMVL